MVFPDPVIRVAIEPKTKAGQDKMTIALVKLAEEDPTFKTYTDQETGQTIIAGMGELHLEIIVDRLLREFKVEATVGKPQVAYQRDHRARRPRAKAATSARPAVTASSVTAVIEIDARGARRRLLVREQDRRRRDPQGIHRAHRSAGIREAAQSGVLGGFEVVDFKATRGTTAAYHDVDSSEMAFKIAGSMAFKEAMAKADPCLLEPMMKVEVIVPEAVHGRRDGRYVQPPRPHRRHGSPRR